MNWVGAGLDCNMITQPNPWREIMVTLSMVASMARADSTICICFVDGAVADRLVILDCLKECLGLVEHPLLRGQGKEPMC